MVKPYFFTKEKIMLPFDSVVIVDFNPAFHNGANVHAVFGNTIKLDEDEVDVFSQQYTSYLTEGGTDQ